MLKKRRSKIFYIENKTEFFKTLRPNEQLKTAVSDLCISAVDWFDAEFDKEYGNGKIRIFASRESTVIRQDFENTLDTPIYFSLKTLHTFLCLFFSQKNKAIKDYYVEHTIEDLKNFFKLIHIEAPKNKNYLNQYNEFIELISPFILNKFKGYDFKLNNLWKWEFINAPQQTSKKEKLIKEEVPYEKILDNAEALPKQEQEQELAPYYKKLQNKFKLIRLRAANFKISIDDFIKKPLLKRDLDLKKDIERLEKKRDNLLNKKPFPEKAFSNLSKQIMKLDSILHKKHDIIDIITIGKDIFIEAPAGSGKSTLLRWLTYQFAKKPKGFYPVFVELMYNTENDLQKLIKEKCDADYFEKLIKDNGKILLFLDGFDQFKGNKLKFFKDIEYLKNINSNIQIVFSGRDTPNLSKHNIELVVYELTAFEDEDIKKICVSYLKEKQGLFYNDFFVARNLKRYIDKPLYLCFLLAQIKREINAETQSEAIIKELDITNKGRLLKKVLVDYFINKYEEDPQSNLTSEQWKLKKRQQLELINFLAYHMTFYLKDEELITWNTAKKVIKSYCDKNNISEIELDFVLNEFVKHNLLHLEDGKLSFDRKELRFFFTALFLEEKVTSFEALKKYRETFNKYTNDESTWNNIQQYLIGLVNPEAFLSSFKRIDFNAPVLFDTEFLEQFKLYRGFVDQKNFPENHDYLNEAYLVSIIKLILQKFYEVKNNTKGEVTIFSLRPLLRILIKKLKIPNRYISSSIENALNKQFFQFTYQLHYGGDMGDLLYSFTRYDFKVTLKELISILNIVKEEDYGYKRHIYDSVLRQENVSIRLSPEEKAEIVFDYLFNFENSKAYGDMFNYKSARLSLFSRDVLSNYSSHFYNLLLNKLDEIPLFKLKRFLVTASKGGKGHWYIFNKGILSPENVHKIFDFTKIKFLKKGKSFHTLMYTLKHSTDNLLVKLFQDYFIESILDTQIQKKEKLQAFHFLFKNKRQQDIKLLLNCFLNQDTDIINICLEGLSKNFPQEYRKQKESFNEDLINLYCEILEADNCTKEITENIIRHVKYNNTRLDNIVLDIHHKNKFQFLTGCILDYIGDFQVKQGIPLLEAHITSNFHGLISLYNLFKVNHTFYFKHFSKFQKELHKINSFLEIFNKKSPLEKEDTSMFLDALYVGDYTTFRLIENIRERLDTRSKYLDHNLSYQDRWFIEYISEKLTEKCKILDLI